MLSDLRFRLRSLLLKSRTETELTDELQFHYQRPVEKYLESGLTRQEAQRQARILFGGIDQVKERCREARGLTFIEILGQDARYALRLCPLALDPTLRGLSADEYFILREQGRAFEEVGAYLETDSDDVYIAVHHCCRPDAGSRNRRKYRNLQRS